MNFDNPMSHNSMMVGGEQVIGFIVSQSTRPGGGFFHAPFALATPLKSSYDVRRYDVLSIEEPMSDERKTNPPKTPHTSVRWTDEDTMMIDKLAKHHGIENRSSLLRMLIRKEYRKLPKKDREDS